MAKLTLNRSGAGWLAGVGLLSASMLGLEIALTNVLGVLLQYHYVSLLISLAVLGTGAGAYAAVRFGGKAGRMQAAAPAGWASMAAGGYAILLSFVLARFPYSGQLAFYALLCALPFLLFGWVTGRALASGTAPAPAVYAADLLGAAAGALLGYILTERLGGFAAVFLMSAPAFAAALALFAGGRGMRRRYAVLAAVLLLAATPPAFETARQLDGWQLDFAAFHGAAPDKTIVGTLRSDPSAHVVSTHWDGFARTDTVATADDSRRMLFVNGGAGSYMYRFDGSLSSVAGLARDIEFLPFAAGRADRTAVIGAGGGRDILYALLAGAKDVTAVELSSGIVRSMREQADYNGGLLDRPGVKTVVGDGRSVLTRSAGGYDLIVLDLVYSQVGGMGGQALSENYVFTREAFKEYLAKLAPGGRLAILSHQGIEGVRAYYTGLEALMSDGERTAAEASRHTALLLATDQSSSPQLTLSVIQNTPLDSSQLNLLQTGARSLGLRPLFLPGSDEELLKPLVQGQVPFDRFVRDSDYAVHPVKDDRPFFFQVDPGLPPALGQWLAAAAALTLLAAFVIGIGEYGPGRASRLRAGKPRLKSYPLYLLLGIGYMSVQTALIQKALLYLGSPALASIAVIMPLLLGGSLGSAAAGRFRLPAYAGAGAAFAAAVLLLLAEPALSDSLLVSGDSARLAFVGVSALLLGLPMGMPLPSGLREDDRRLPGSSAFFFAVSGLAGIWGSLLGSAVSMTAGVTATLAAGCLCYAAAAAADRFFTDRRKDK